MIKLSKKKKKKTFGTPELRGCLGQTEEITTIASCLHTVLYPSGYVVIILIGSSQRSLCFASIYL